MGESVKIIDLIKRMVNFSGLTLSDNFNKNGDIEIKITGLRPGEKLYEELLIGDNPQKTIHPKIKKINEPFIPYSELKKTLDQLQNLLNSYQSEEVKKLLDKSIKLYSSSSEIVDHLFLENKKYNNKNDLLSKQEINNVIKIKT